MSEATKTGWDILDEARTMLRQAVAGVPADGWSRPTPCQAWTVSQVLQHAALDQQVWSAVVGGTEPSGEDPFAPSGQLGAEPTAYIEQALTSSVHPWTVISKDAGPVPTPLPQGTMEPAAAAGAVEPLRAYGAYAAPLEHQTGADEAAVLLAYLGRQPAWTAGK